MSFTKHMAYYLAPFASNDQWARNVNELFRRIHIFDGRRIVAIADGPWLHDADRISKLFLRRDCQVIIVGHDPRRHDSNGFPLLIRSHFTDDPNAVLWYGHGKGVSRGWFHNGKPKEYLQWWRNTMYHYTLDRWQECLGLLETHSCVGTHRLGPQQVRAAIHAKMGMIPPQLLQGGVFRDYKNLHRWHFAGTFFWVRCRDLYQPGWDSFGNSGWYSEAYLGDRFPYGQSVCLAHDQWHPRTPDEFGDHIPDDPGYLDILAEWQAM